MTATRPCVVGFGELVWDVLPDAKMPGGAPANFAWHAQQLGVESLLVSAVGDDAPGHELLAWLHQMHLAADCIQTNARPTGRVNVAVNAHGEPAYLIQEDTAWDHIHWTDALAVLARRADCVCFGSLAQRSTQTRETLHRFLSTTQPDGLRVFDVNLRQPLPDAGVIEQTIPFTDMLKLNEDEWSFVANKLGLSQDWEKGCQTLLRNGPIRLIAVTRGARGSALVTRDDILELPSDAVEIHDTIGAGDAFCAGLVVGLLQRKPLRDAQRTAAATAAFVCTQPGATPLLPDEVKDQLVAPTPSIHPPKSRLRAPGAFVAQPNRQPTFDGEPAESH